MDPETVLTFGRKIAEGLEERQPLLAAEHHRPGRSRGASAAVDRARRGAQFRDRSHLQAAGGEDAEGILARRGLDGVSHVFAGPVAGAVGEAGHGLG